MNEDKQNLWIFLLSVALSSLLVIMALKTIIELI